MAKKEEYSLWKKLAWRFSRVFLAALFANLGLNLEKVSGWDNVWPLLLLPALSAAVVSLSKFARDQWGSADKSTLLHKLPL